MDPALFLLFTRINSYASLPERLLRPPPGWPDEFEGALTALPPDEQRIVGLLYGDAEPGNITYRDIYEVLCKELAGCNVPKVLLLGSHGAEQNKDGLLKEAVRRIVEVGRLRLSGSRDATRAEARRTSGFDPPRSPAAPSKRLSRASCASVASMSGEVRPSTAAR